MREYYDGASGGSETDFSLPEVYKEKQLDDARVASDFYETLNWKTLYKTVTIKEKSKVDDEEVYVVVKTPEKGNARHRLHFGEILPPAQARSGGEVWGRGKGPYPSAKLTAIIGILTA